MIWCMKCLWDKYLVVILEGYFLMLNNFSCKSKRCSN